MDVSYFIYAIYLIAYLLGSIPTAMWVSKCFNLPDPTKDGSNNPGATNMLRIAGKKPAIITLIGDFLKGIAAIALGIMFEFSQLELLFIMLLCLLGHMYPIFNRFVGGKGVATFFGCTALVDVIVGGIVAICWLVLAKVAKISSLSAIISILVAPCIAWLMGWDNAEITAFVIICALILWRHKANIQRLVQRTEN